MRPELSVREPQPGEFSMTEQDQKFESLKQKYQSVINLAKQSGVRLSHVHMEGGKLFVQGEAPSDQVKNKVWDEIKRIDSTYSDLTADITVNSSLPQGMPAQTETSAKVYTVQAGDSLSKISRQFYGDANQYNRIFEANRDVLSDPNKIFPGQQLRIPA
jgi:LysM repeat protein